MKIRGIFLSLVILLFLVLPLTLPKAQASDDDSFSDTYANTSTGSDTYDGSTPVYTSGIHGPTKTIGAALSTVETNGTVHVAAGTYNEKVLLPESQSLIGAGALSTVINAGGNGTVVEASSAPGSLNTISGFTITGGGVSGSYAGGGIYVSSTHIVTINDCAITGNIKGEGSGPMPLIGGGVCNDNGVVYMNRCTVSGNSATLFGGGIANISSGGPPFGVMTLTNCTISGNSVTAFAAAGGGLYNSAVADIHLLNVTIANNRATQPDSAGGGFSNSSISSMYFKNCIVANNTAGLSQFDNGYDGVVGGVHSQGNNLDSENSCFFDQASDQINTDPLLGVLQNNGGQTSTIAITTASPAYNRGDRSAAPDTDQRGIARPTGAFCSIGAFEPTPSADIRTASTGTSLGTATFTINTGSISGLTNIPASNMPCSSGGYIFPFGMFSYNVTNLTPGQTVNVTIRLPNPIPMGSKIFKCQSGNLVDFSPYAQQPDPNTFVLTLRDGGQGDADGVANGAIVDPCGPAFLFSSPPQSSSAQVPTIAQTPAPIANIAVQSASLSTAKVAPGAPVTVTADVANKGTVDGSAQIKLYVNGQEEAHQGVNLSSGSSSPVKFSVSRDEPGTYSVYVGSTPAGTFEVDQFADPNLILYISGGLLVLAFVMGVILILRRRQPGR